MLRIITTIMLALALSLSLPAISFADSHLEGEEAEEGEGAGSEEGEGEGSEEGDEGEKSD